MATLADYMRVLQGGKILLTKIIQQASPEVRQNIERSAQHLSDIALQIKQICQDNSNKNDSCQSQQHNSTETMNAEIDKEIGKTYEKTKSEEKTEPITPPNISPLFLSYEGKNDIKVMSQFSSLAFHKPSTEKKDPAKDIIGFDSVGADVADLANNVIKNENLKVMREREVPSTQFGRMAGFGSLAVRMAFGEAIDRATTAIAGGQGHRGISDQNADRLAESLCRMRGAALKLGQMLSLQDEESLPPALSKALERVKQAADYMPRRQLEQQLETQLGKQWREKFLDFDYIPIAAASIGQVHRAKLHDSTDVAIKIQYPGVADSIDSDLQNLKALVRVTNLLPPGLFVDNIIKVASTELTAECDYVKEAEHQTRYRDLVLADPVLRKHTYVPKVYSELSTSRVLVTELVAGIPIDQAIQYSQAVRNAIARTALITTVRELFEWRFIQSDPNFANFLYDAPGKRINFIDFGAARAFDKSFVDGYMKLVWAAANKDRATIMDISKELGFLTGDESQQFLDAHGDAGLVLGEPFISSGPFDFANSKLTARIGQYGGTFMKYRLTPPPNEAYSLHRKLAGAFLLCIKLKANIPCRDILEDTYRSYNFDPIENASSKDKDSVVT